MTTRVCNIHRYTRLRMYICDAIQQKVHNVGKRNFAREAHRENEIKMIKVAFLLKIVGRDI